MTAGLNKGEARNSLAQTVFFDRLEKSPTALSKTRATRWRRLNKWSLHSCRPMSTRFGRGRDCISAWYELNLDRRTPELTGHRHARRSNRIGQLHMENRSSLR